MLRVGILIGQVVKTTTEFGDHIFRPFGMIREVAKGNFLTPVPRSTLTAEICQKMVNHLVQGDWAEGERIPPERELCQKLGVGRSSLREAMKALEIIGMVETRVGEGTFVCRRSDFLSNPLLWAIAGSGVTEADEIIEARKLIEVELAGLAATRATPEDLQQIGLHLDEMDVSLNDRVKFLQADVAFHLAVGQSGHNRILLNSLHLIRNLMHLWMRSALEEEGVAAKAFEQHRAIFLAIAKRNAVKARESMQFHLEAMAEYLRPVRHLGQSDGASFTDSTSEAP